MRPKILLLASSTFLVGVLYAMAWATTYKPTAAVAVALIPICECGPGCQCGPDCCCDHALSPTLAPELIAAPKPILNPYAHLPTSEECCTKWNQINQWKIGIESWRDAYADRDLLSDREAFRFNEELRMAKWYTDAWWACWWIQFSHHAKAEYPTIEDQKADWAAKLVLLIGEGAYRDGEMPTPFVDSPSKIATYR